MSDDTPVERRLRDLAENDSDCMCCACAEDSAAIDLGREAIRIAREGVPRYLQNGGCSNCGAVPHTATCLIGQLAALLTRCAQDGPR